MTGGGAAPETGIDSGQCAFVMEFESKEKAEYIGPNAC